MIAVVVMFFVVAVVVLAVYGLLRPFTHFSYRHLESVGSRWTELHDRRQSGLSAGGCRRSVVSGRAISAFADVAALSLRESCAAR